ncbi:hypothetical protein GCM10027341_18850 [Spirosoma knui]
MRTSLLFIILLFASCRRPSKQLAATLTPIAEKSTADSVADYTRFLKAGDELVAHGESPNWTLTVNPSKNGLQFKAGTDESINTSVPERIIDSDGSFYFDVPVKTERMKITFAPDSCIDKRSGQRMDYRVQVDVGGKHYVGCGVSLRQLALLQDIWVLSDFKGKRIAVPSGQGEAPRLEIRLTEGQVTGTTGCNRLTGRIQADSRRVLFGPLITTKMACAGDVGTLEGDLLSALNEPLSYRIGEARLTLLRGNEAVMVFKKVD